MIQRTFSVWTLATLVLLLSADTRLLSAEKRPAQSVKIFSGEPRLVIVNGYSTSFHWPAVLQRKLDKYFDGKRVITVESATKGGTPIAKWMDAQAGRPLSAWTERLVPALKDKGDRPAIVLAQQSLQWAYGQRQAGIRNSKDAERIEAGAEVIRKYANLLIKSGADEVFIAMHIYKKPMEPVIGNERFALAEYMKSRPRHVHPGPDVWEPTSKVWPQAFRADKVHPNEMGAEIIAHHWFEALLKHDGREVPPWSRQEMLTAMKKSLKEVAQSDRQSQLSQPSRRAQQAQRPTGGGRDMSFAGLSSRHDRNKDGKITKGEFRAPQRVFQQLDKNKDGVLTKDDFDKSATSTENQPSSPRSSGPADKTDLGELAAKLFPINQTATDEQDSLSIFNRRILPIMQAKNPSSCSECHLSGVDLKDYIGPDQATTFASLRGRGLIDMKSPDKSKILKFIARKPKKPSLITDKIRRQEYEAFRAWVLAAVKDPELLKTAAGAEPLGPKLPDEVIRHARKDRVLASFIDNIWTEVARCSGCHSPDQNSKQVKEFGEQVSWITLRDPEATLAYMLEAELIDVDKPDQSLLLLKPTLQVEHEGGQKLLVGDRTYKQFRRFIDDYAAVVNGKYKTENELPRPGDELAVATSMTSGIWLKLTGVPARYDKMLLQVDLYRRDLRDWSKYRWGTADRGVYGKGKLWQQTLTLTAPRKSRRADEIRRNLNLPAGEYLAKIYIDHKGKLAKDLTAQLGESEFVGQVVVKTEWTKGYGRMTVVRFPTR